MPRLQGRLHLAAPPPALDRRPEKGGDKHEQQDSSRRALDQEAGIAAAHLIGAHHRPFREPGKQQADHHADPAAEVSCRSAGRALSAFVSLSPMTHDPLATARLVSNAALVRAAVVYDFIPRHEPGRYLAGPVSRVEYATALRWLGRYDLFAPISQATREELGALLGVPASASCLTGAALDPRFETIAARTRQSAPSHLLVVGGGDPRKNPEVVVRAHAGSARLQRRAVPLVVAGSYGPADEASLRALAASCGGDPSLVQVPGRIADERLFGLYAQAFAIICPSRDEGFSLPVVEGMAAGLPCLASDIAAHRELVADPALRFAVDDAAALTPLLDRAADDAEWRAQVVASQADTWQRFRAETVADRFWTPVLSALQARPARPVVSRRARPKVALLSPMPPERSGVADYTAATCAEFGKLVELDVFSGVPDPPPAPGVQRMLPMGALPHLRPGYDRVVSVIGNSHFHLAPFNFMRRYGSACIAHDARMVGFYRYLLGLEHTLAIASRELGRPVTERQLDSWIADEATLEALFLSEIAECATPSIVHSAVTAEAFRSRYDSEAKYIPFSIYRPWSSAQLTRQARAAARERLGLQPGEIVIATFGFVQNTKAPEECVWALELLRSWGFDARLDFVGATYWLPDQGAGLRALIHRLGLERVVTFAEGFVPEQTYQDYLVGADLGVQLRTYGLGGLSGALLDCAAAGLRSVTNASLGHTVGAPASYVRCIPDSISALLLAEALADLLESGPGPQQLEDDRQAFSEERSFRRYAQRLCDALELETAQ